ncbi:hypothetical protein GOEFS_080_00060 [Gordonia effusa NBRC 100432]|uniref:DUF4350 domain-containing protein n=1 Tax=Gordonia effusa NBRC 100432 TaxID=1077974 RepID=H0R2J3_9ACTN|nr:DUF4350 domain-containing protein [Gordonia effusa]GAB19294.1 hypothetical protein GOEFS_080_00060 [Gordonia effusa NBRC 100432]
MSATQAPQKSRHRLLFALLAIVAVLIVGGGLAVAINAAANKVGSNANSEPLDPNNPGNSGAQALARVIASHGVDVEVVRNQRQFSGADRPGANTTVVVAGADPLTPYTAGKLRERIGGAARLVLLNPHSTTLTSLNLPATDWGSSSFSPSVRADCEAFGISASDVMTTSTRAYTITAPSAPSTACFKVRSGSSQPDASNVLVLQSASSLPEVVIASGEQFTNDKVTRLDNAGVAVRMLGGHDRLLWYVPSDKDVAPSEPTGPSDIPRAIGPLIALSFVALLAAMFWRGRRFGKLVVEPLPAVVKAIETTEARGRLYHQAGDIPRAASRLRNHTIVRITKTLGLPARTELDTVIDTAATASGSDQAQLKALLSGPLPNTEEQLLQFANALSRIEEEVHRRYD